MPSIPPPGSIPPIMQVARLMDGFLTTQLLYVAAKLDIAGVIGDEPRTCADIAAAVGADPAALGRVLRGLAAEGILDEHEDGRFSLSDAGDSLRRDRPGSLHGAIIARGELYYAAGAGLLDAVREGSVPFERVHGSTFFEFLERHPDRAVTFNASMADRSQLEAEAVVAAYDFSPFERIVDVGGGSGDLLLAILAAYPALQGVLVDRPVPVERAQERLARGGVSDRATCVVGDFFTSDLPAGDAYLLSRIIHDWDDDDAGRILANIHRAMGPDGTLLLIEAVLPERARDLPAAIRMDLVMLTLFHGRERTAAEFETLLAAAGFQLTRIVPTRSLIGVSVIEATRKPKDDSPAPAR